MKKLKTLLQFNFKYVIVIVFCFLYVFITTNLIEYSSLYSPDETYLEGKVESYSINGNALKMDVLGREIVKAIYYIKSMEEKTYLENNIVLGSTIKLEGEFKTPSNNTIPNTFNYRNYLYNHKIFYTFTVSKYELDNKTSFLYKIKDDFLKRIYSMPNNEYILALLMGDKALLSSDEYTSFQINGTAHLLAISGLHIGLLISILSFFLKKLKYIKKFIITFLVLIFFAFLTGFSPSVLRVIVFFSIANINKFKDLKLSNLKVLFITAVILIIINPFIIYDYGFLYSIIITGGIIYYQDKIKGNYFAKLFKLSLISFLFSLPITAVLNYEINLLSILINMIFVPFISFIIYPCAIISFIIPNNIWEILINLMTSLSNFFKEISIMINIPKMSIVLIISYYLILIFCKRKKYLLFLLCIPLVINFLINKIDDKYYVTYLDVGQGDSSIIISPYKSEAIMIDTGGKASFKTEEWMKTSKNYNLTDNSIKYLKSMGITKLDYLIITHGDYDHMGEALNLVNNFKVEKVIFNCGFYNDLEKELIKVLDKMKIKYYSCIKELNIDSNKLYFLQTKEYDNENDNSNVIYTELNGYKFMFMGDASITTEKEILDKYNLTDIDVLKVGHHGSKTSSSIEFINEINPKYSIISVGKNNRYGHPSIKVLNNLSDSKIYRTDQCGSIMFKIKDNKLNIETCSP